jgi:hypothetical protein
VAEYTWFVRRLFFALLTIALSRAASPVGWEEARRHLIGPAPVIRSNESRHSWTSVQLSGAEVNARNNNGETPLMWAVSSSAAEVLLKAGADPSLRSNSGKTALDYARERKRDKVTALLEKAAAR